MSCEALEIRVGDVIECHPVCRPDVIEIVTEGPQGSGGLTPIDPLPDRPTTLNETINLLVQYGMCSLFIFGLFVGSVKSADFGDIPASLALPAGTSVRRNAGNTAFESFTAGTGGGAVDSVFGRTGVVVAVSGDYTAAQVTNAADTTGSYANPSWITSLIWSKITSTPTTIAGYGITDFNSLGDARWVLKNGSITGATKTKITYDTKGLVTASADATTADIADSTDKRYVTDAQRTVITNTSGTNTGDQTSIVGITGTKAQCDRDWET